MASLCNTSMYNTTGAHNDTYGNCSMASNETHTNFTDMPITTSTIVMVLMYGLICVIGMIGNWLVILVIIRYTKMKTVTNMYILNLSIADGVFLLGLPMIMTTSLVRHWVFGAVLCKIYYISTGVNMFTGAFTLTVMSADRFLAVCYPISSMRYRTPRYALVAIALTWMTSFLVILPIILYAHVIPSHYDPTLQSCRMLWPSGQKAYVFYTLLLGFVIPILLISLFYALLLVRLRTTGPTAKSKEKKRSHRKVTKLVTLIIAIYIVCWLPYWAFQVHLIIPDDLILQNWKILMFQVFTVLSYANSMVNPCLYAFTNENFRESFISAFRCLPDPILSGRRNSEYSVAATKSHKITANNNAANGVRNGKSKRKMPSLLRGCRKAKKAHNEYEFTTLTTTGGEANQDTAHKVLMPTNEEDNVINKENGEIIHS